MRVSWIKSTARVRRESRQRDAERRQAEHDALSGYEKLARIAERPGESKREKARLLAVI